MAGRRRAGPPADGPAGGAQARGRAAAAAASSDSESEPCAHGKCSFQTAGRKNCSMLLTTIGFALFMVQLDAESQAKFQSYCWNISSSQLFAPSLADLLQLL